MSARGVSRLGKWAVDRWAAVGVGQRARRFSDLVAGGGGSPEIAKLQFCQARIMQ
jgi:hypothetical protein